jgi:hypothetical protein
MYSELGHGTTVKIVYEPFSGSGTTIIAAEMTGRSCHAIELSPRVSNLYWITDETGREVKFEPNPAQLQFLDDVHALNIILKARQLGFTTLCCLIYLDACSPPTPGPASSPIS